MCLSVPVKVKSVENKWAVVETEAGDRKVSLALMKEVAPGDFILVHGDLALNKVDEAEVEKIQDMIGQLTCHCHE